MQFSLHIAEVTNLSVRFTCLAISFGTFVFTALYEGSAARSAISVALTDGLKCLLQSAHGIRTPAGTNGGLVIQSDCMCGWYCDDTPCSRLYIRIVRESVSSRARTFCRWISNYGTFPLPYLNHEAPRTCLRRRHSLFRHRYALADYRGQCHHV